MARNVGIADIARDSGFSINTVSRALNNMPGVSPQTRARVLAVAERLRYTPSRVARSLLSHKATRTLGLVVTDCTNPFYAGLIRAVEDTAFNRDYNVILCNSGESHQREIGAIRMLLENRVAGMLITPVQESSEQIMDLVEREVPFVLVARRFEDVDACYVTSDNVGGAYDAASLLVSLGHRRIGHLTGRQGISSVAERLLGYKRALTEHGLNFDDTLVARDERDLMGGYRSALRLLALEPRATAIFAYNDLQAFGALRAARERRLRVPEELAIVGFDTIELSTVCDVPLTTVSQPVHELGRLSVEMLLRMMDDPRSIQERQVVLPTELVLRASSGSRIAETVGSGA
jgi:LacI family transcriptional regulator